MENPRAFCRQVMHNIVIDQARLQRRQVPQIRLVEGHDGGDPRSADSASAIELRPVLLDALRTLTAQQRTIVVLRYFDDRSENEVAGLLGVIGTVASTSGSGARPAQAIRDGSGPTGQATTAQLTVAQRHLFALSAAAAKTSRPSGRYVVLAEKAYSIGTDAGGNSSVSGPKTSVIDTVTGGGLTYQDLIVSGSGSAGTATPPAVGKDSPGDYPTIAQLDAMPTDPTALRAELLAQAKQQLAQEKQQLAQESKAPAGRGKKYKPTHIPQPTADDLVFDQASNLLWQPDLSPALRSAVYKVLAATPSVIVKTGAADSSGRPAVEISRTDTLNKTNVETFENQKTGATLESAWVNPGETDEDLYLHITYTNTIPANPYRG